MLTLVLCFAISCLSSYCLTKFYILFVESYLTACTVFCSLSCVKFILCFKVSIRVVFLILQSCDNCQNVSNSVLSVVTVSLNTSYRSIFKILFKVTVFTVRKTPLETFPSASWINSLPKSRHSPLYLKLNYSNWIKLIDNSFIPMRS